MKIVLLLPVLLALGCNGSSPTPQTGAAVGTSVDLLACGWKVYTQDTAKTPVEGWLEIALDIADQCGADVEEIVALFGPVHPVSTAAKTNAGQVHAKVLAARARATSAGGK